MSTRPSWRISFLISCLVICLILANASSALFGQQNNQTRVSIGVETTHLSGPLDNEGYVDYLKAVNDAQLAGLDPEDNFAIVLWRVLGSDSVRQSEREDFFVPINFDIDKEPRKPKLITPGIFFSSYPFKSRQSENKAARFFHGPFVPWTTSDSLSIAAFLTKNDEPLNVLAAGLKRPKFVQPYVSDMEPELLKAILFGHAPLKRIARMFAKRALLRLGERTLGDALSDAISCQRIGYLLTQRETALEVKSGFEICGWASEVERQILATPGLSQTQLQTHLDALMKSPPTRDIGEIIGQGDRWMTLDIAQMNARHAGKPNSPPSIRQSLPASVDYDNVDFNAAFRIINPWYDRGVAVVQSGSHDDILDGIQGLYRDLGALESSLKDQRGKQPTNVGEHLGKIWITSMFMDLQGFYLTSTQAKSDWRLTTTGYAIRLFELKNGRFSNGLNELMGNFQTSEMSVTDPFTEKPFLYEFKNGTAKVSGSTWGGEKHVAVIPGAAK